MTVAVDTTAGVDVTGFSSSMKFLNLSDADTETAADAINATASQAQRSNLNGFFMSSVQIEFDVTMEFARRWSGGRFAYGNPTTSDATSCKPI
jgi:hypothetical protein